MRRWHHAKTMNTWERTQPAGLAFSSTEHAGGVRSQGIFTSIAHVLVHATKDEDGILSRIPCVSWAIFKGRLLEITY